MVVLLPTHWEAVQSICLDGGVVFLFHLSYFSRSHDWGFYIRSTPGRVVTKSFGRSKLVVFYHGIYAEFSFVFFCYRRLLNPRMERRMYKVQPFRISRSFMSSWRRPHLSFFFLTHSIPEPLGSLRFMYAILGLERPGRDTLAEARREWIKNIRSNINPVT